MNKIAKLFSFFSLFFHKKQISEEHLVCLAQLRDGARTGFKIVQKEIHLFHDSGLMRYRYRNSHGDENCSSVTLLSLTLLEYNSVLGMCLFLCTKSASLADRSVYSSRPEIEPEKSKSYVVI
jgi:hypothetical protein